MVILAIHLAGGCARASSPPRPVTGGPPSEVQVTILTAAPDERGSTYVAEHPGEARVRLDHRYQVQATGEWRTRVECRVGGPVFYARTATLTPPGEFLEAPGGVVPPGEKYLHLRMDTGPDGDDCYRATRGTTPVGHGTWWMFPDGRTVPMSEGGDTSQCDGPCQWFTSVNLR